MARVGKVGDRGAVYVEFIIAFFPLFLMFLAICQQALLATAEAIVRHAAYMGVRSAIVVLEDKPKNFDDAPCGSLSLGDPAKVTGIEDLVTVIGIATTSDATDLGRIAYSQARAAIMPGNATEELQAGARMVPIRTAAETPLIVLAPSALENGSQDNSLARAIATSGGSQLNFALQYTKAATAVTLHDNAEDIALAKDPVDMNAPVTVRVTYAYHCTVPVVRALMCRSLSRLTNANPLMAQTANALPPLVSADARFKLLTATATLPNQGASYYARDGK